MNTRSAFPSMLTGKAAGPAMPKKPKMPMMPKGPSMPMGPKMPKAPGGKKRGGRMRKTTSGY